VTLDQIRALLMKRASKFKTKRVGSTGIPGWSKHHGVNKSHVSEFLNGKRLPGTSILNALNLEWRIVRKDRQS
jgi:hypothetical protein